MPAGAGGRKVGGMRSVGAWGARPATDPAAQLSDQSAAQLVRNLPRAGQRGLAPRTTRTLSVMHTPPTVALTTRRASPASGAESGAGPSMSE